MDDDDVNRGEGGVDHDDGVSYHTSQEHLAGALWPVAHAENELKADEQDASISENNEDVLADVVAERIESWVSKRARDEVEG